MHDEPLLATMADQVQPDRCAVVVIDVQRDFCSSQGAMARVMGLDVSAMQAAVPRLNRLVDAARIAGTPIAWVREVFSPDRMLPSQRVIHGDGDSVVLIRADGPGIDWYEGLTGPEGAEPVFTKWNYDAFEGTDLDLWLRANDRRTLVMAGFTTNVCVETSARHGYIKGYHIVVVSDCTGAPDPAEHAMALQNIDRYFGSVATADAVEAVWRRR